MTGKGSFHQSHLDKGFSRFRDWRILEQSGNKFSLPWWKCSLSAIQQH